MKSTPSNVAAATAVQPAGAMTPSHAFPRRAVTGAGFLVAALALTGTGPPAVAMYAADDGGHTASAAGPTAGDMESLLAARHRQMDAAWRVGPLADPVTSLRRATVSWVY